MELLLNSKQHIRELKLKVDRLDNSLFIHFIINNYEITEDAISIVMTASNRSKQTYFTLQNMLRSICKNIHIILVDDSDIDPIDINTLKTFPYYIDFISIKRENKSWVNPVVNYNIGFKFIKGNKVVIQNAEVCYVGDPLNLIYNSMENDNYYVFDVRASNSYIDNEEIYKNDLDSIDIYEKTYIKYYCWYQHYEIRNEKFHFFTAMTTTTFNKINEFSYDYSLGVEYDDNDFVLKIISQNITICNIEYDIKLMGGIHLYHQLSAEGYCKNKVGNGNIFDYKKNIWEKQNKYISIFDN
jgi:hypothetical protein